jgi:hypothetical protein
MTEETREPSLSGRGRSRYSSLGSATAAQAAAAASRMSDPDLMRARLFGHSACQTPPSRPTAHSSRAEPRRPVYLPSPGVTNAYATGSAADHHRGPRDTRHRAPDGTAPGMSALEPTTATDESNTESATSGMSPPGRTVRPSLPTPGRPAVTPPTSARRSGRRPSSSSPMSPTTPTTSGSSSLVESQLFRSCCQARSHRRALEGRSRLCLKVPPVEADPRRALRAP